jgi:pyrroline-5-carboxylate reductase
MDIQQVKVGLIGAGNMGSALAAGIAAGIGSDRILSFDTDRARLTALQRETGIPYAEFIEEVPEYSDVILLCVKPDVIPLVCEKLTEYSGIILSAAAGIKIESIKRVVGRDKKIIRSMPNTPCMAGAGMIAISPDDNSDPDDVMLVKELLGFTGLVLQMPEKMINSVTAVSGSGPAYVFTFIQAMADAAVKLGINRQDALILAGQTVFGSAKMFLDKIENPIKMRDNVISPAGTTIEAIHILEKEGFSGIIIDAIEAAAKKARELDSSK